MRKQKNVVFRLFIIIKKNTKKPTHNIQVKQSKTFTAVLYIRYE